MTREDAAALDTADPLAPFRARFVIADPNLCYLDGNSLGRLPLATADRLRRVVEHEWGAELIESWERWIDLPEQVGDAIAPLIGAAAGTVIVADSTTINLHAVLDAACRDRPERRALVVPDGDFPTDRFVVAGIADARGLEVRSVESDPIAGPSVDRIAAALAPGDVAVVLTSAVDFRSGALLDVDGLVAAASAAGAWVCLDLSHAAGSVPVALEALGVELAVGCTYKHLCGGPGAPAFLYVRPDLVGALQRPQWGWFAQRDPFTMAAAHDPADGIGRFLAGTPAVLGLAAVQEGVALVAEAGIDAIREKVVALVDLALTLVADRLVPVGFALASPPDAARLGAHLSVSHPDALAIGTAARAEGVVPDVRPPDRIRLGLNPLSTSFVELWDGLDRIARLVAEGTHRHYAAATTRVT